MSSKGSSRSVIRALTKRVVTVLRIPRQDGLKDYNGTAKDSIESFEFYLSNTIAEFDKTNPGPLYPLSEYGNTCWLLGCEEMHVECRDKTHAIVQHCGCDPNRPSDDHRHVYEFYDLVEPPSKVRLLAMHYQRIGRGVDSFGFDHHHDRLGSDPFASTFHQNSTQFTYASATASSPSSPASTSFPSTSTRESNMVKTPSFSSEESYELQVRHIVPPNTRRNTSSKADEVMNQTGL